MSPTLNGGDPRDVYKGIYGSIALETQWLTVNDRKSYAEDLLLQYNPEECPTATYTPESCQAVTQE